MNYGIANITYKQCKIEIEYTLFARYKVYDLNSGAMIMEGSISGKLGQAVNRLKAMVTEYRSKK